ncbi:uncharacterized protein LOC102808709 [Saccoglossus kowalevskii]
MNLDVLTAIEGRLRKERDGIERKIVLLDGESQEDFINKHLNHLADEAIGRYTNLRKASSHQILYKCERCNNPTGKSKGCPSKTRANSCSSYVSFTFAKNANDHYCVIRLKKEHHVGHNPLNKEKYCTNRICPDLLELIRIWTMQNLQCSEILVKCNNWSKSRGHKDMRYRQYYPTPADINYLRSKVLNELRFNKNDALSVDKLIKSDLKENIVHYQPLSRQTDQPLEIVYMSAFQKEQYQLFGNTMVFIDATYRGVTAYGYAFYCVMVHNNAGHGVPVAYVIISKETKEVLERCFSKIRDSCDSVYPRVIMVDKDITEISALRCTFPNSDILLCWFHVLQAVHRWLVKRDGGLSGQCNTAKGNLVMEAMYKMRDCLTKEQFDETSKVVTEEIDNKVGNTCISNYLRDQWISVAIMWCQFGRKMFHAGHNTINIAEKFFYSLKYQFLKGMANRRIDDLFSAKVDVYYSYLQGLKEAGRLPSDKRGHEVSAQHLLKSGIESHVKKISNGIWSVPSEKTKGLEYTVDLIRHTCNCWSFCKGDVCKHILFVKILAVKNGIDISSLRYQIGKSIIEKGAFKNESEQFTVYDSDLISVVDVKHSRCSCIASSYGETCLCVLAWKYVCTDTNIDASVESSDSKNDQCSIIVSEESISNQSSKELIRELYEWSESDDFVESDGLRNALRSVKNEAFLTYKIKTRTKLIKSLHPYRRQIEKSCKILSVDHKYEISDLHSKRPIRNTPRDSDRDYVVKTNKVRIVPYKNR